MINFNEQSNSFYLETPNTSYVMKILSFGTICHVYYGRKIPNNSLDYLTFTSCKPFTTEYEFGEEIGSLECLPQEYPTFGRGDFRRAALRIEDADGRRISSLKYITHNITKGKTHIEKMPQLLAEEDDADTLEIILEDSVAGLTVSLYYCVYSKIDVISRYTKIKNTTLSPIKLNEAASASVDMQLTNDYELIDLNGAWSREFTIERLPIHHGITSSESRRGSTGHQQNPFIALTEKNATEDNGDVYGFALVYSSDFLMSVEKDQFDVMRIQMGINPSTFCWNLLPGETFTTPEAIMVYSNAGLGGMSHIFHSACRGYLGRSRTGCAKRKIVINNWEAMGFNFNAERLKKFISSFRGYGIDTFVLDDGWFGRRDSESSSLGDWEVNPEKLPGGLSEIINTCKANDMDFGIWIEPEMVSENSELYRTHPDWCIHTNNRTTVKARKQLVLDFSRAEVVDYIFNKIYRLINDNEISYVKWDMNRNITDNGSHSLSSESQGEHSHRNILGVYDLMNRLTKAFPEVLFEGCSGGGGRFDFGILYYMPQIWTSDDTDAIQRLYIQYGNSLVYPPSAMSAHVSECPNQQTGRITPIKTRGDVAMLCNFGYELDAQKLSDSERAFIKEQTALHHQLSELIETGTYYRLMNPFEGNTFAWQAVSEDRKTSFAVFVSKLSTPNAPGYVLKFKGLESDLNYFVKELGLNLKGSVLMNAGIQFVPEQRDFYSCTFSLISE